MEERSADPILQRQHGQGATNGKLCSLQGPYGMTGERLFLLCVCSLLNKPTVPKNGTHHTAAVKKKQRKRPLPHPTPQPSLGVSFGQWPKAGSEALAVAVELPLCAVAVSLKSGDYVTPHFNHNTPRHGRGL